MKFCKLLFIFLIFTKSTQSQISVFGKVDHIVPDGTDTQGGIALTVSGSTSPYTYTWNPGAINTKDISSITAGHYTVNVKSASSQTLNCFYKLGYKTIWTNLYAATFRNDSLFSTSGSTAYNAFACSKNTLAANTDGWFEYVITNLSSS